MFTRCFDVRKGSQRTKVFTDILFPHLPHMLHRILFGGVGGKPNGGYDPLVRFSKCIDIRKKFLTQVVRGVRRRRWHRPARAMRVWPIARLMLRPVLAQTGMLALLLGVNQVAPPFLLLAGLPLLRAMLTLSALVWPRGGQHPRGHWLAQVLAALQLALLLSLIVGLLRDHILTSGVLAVDVFRYYCHNTACPHGSFTNLPPDLLPYSPWRTEIHLRALQAYELGHSSYRRVAAGMGVSTATAYRWVSQFGGLLLPVAALSGVVRSSGVVGVDEKWVKVPTNDKPAGKQRQWMYVYVAVDVSTYDLLHVAIFPVRGTDSARAFLLGLRAKGYVPPVIVSDLCTDYDRAIPAVFPRAIHH